VAIGGTQILMQGGMNAELPLTYYLDLLIGIRSRFPNIHIHAFSPPEFVAFARFFRMPVGEVLRLFKEAGLSTIPGGGAEILADRVRKRLSPGKCSGEEWLNVMDEAHKLGMHTSATMMIGHIETIDDRNDHMKRIRERQDWALNNGGGCYTSFIHWPYQAGNMPLDGVKLAEKGGGASEYLRMLALARLYLDNVRNLQSSWVTMGPKVGQLALFFGANDMGSVMMEEQVVSNAGTNFRLDESNICRLIRDAGWVPVQRNQYYEVLKRS